jgi:hypothetical protein
MPSRVHNGNHHAAIDHLDGLREVEPIAENLEFVHHLIAIGILQDHDAIGPADEFLIGDAARSGADDIGIALRLDRPYAPAFVEGDVHQGGDISGHFFGCPEFDLEAGGRFDAVDGLGGSQGFLDLAVLGIGLAAIGDEFGRGLGAELTPIVVWIRILSRQWIEAGARFRDRDRGTSGKRGRGC